MNSKHLKKGDPCPPLVDGKLRIYGKRFCPFAHRALLVATAKKIPYDIVNVNLDEKPEFLFEKNPLGKVPTIETPKGSLYESLIVCDYMDEAYPESGPGGDTSKSNGSNLNPSDPFQKALDRILVEKFATVATLEYKALMPEPGVDDDGLKALLKELYEALIPFETELAKRGTTFFGDNSKPGMVDYMIWPWMERLPTQEFLNRDKFDFSQAKEKLKLLNAWAEEMKKDPAVLECRITPEVHLEYRMGRRQGASMYDFLFGKQFQGKDLNCIDLVKTVLMQ